MTKWEETRMFLMQNLMSPPTLTIWPWSLADINGSWVLYINSMRTIPVPRFIKISSAIAKLRTGHDHDIRPWLWPWPQTEMAESWVLHIRSMRRISAPSFIKIPSAIAKLWTRHDLIFDLDCDLDLWLTGLKVRFCTSGPWGEYLYQVSSGIAKLWTRHDLIFGLECDLDLWQTGPNVGFCTSGPWGGCLYQVSSKSHQSLHHWIL